MVSMNANLNSIEHGSKGTDRTPTKRKDKFFNQTLDYMNHGLSPINSHGNAASSRIHSLYEQHNHDSNNRVRIIDQQMSEVSSKNLGTTTGENGSYSLDPSKTQYRTNNNHHILLNPIKSNSGLKNLRKMDRATILEEIEKNKIEEIRNNLSNNK